MRRNIRVWDSVLHAQAICLARRIQSAAKLRVRHRDWAEKNETRCLKSTALGTCLEICWHKNN